MNNLSMITYLLKLAYLLSSHGAHLNSFQVLDQLEINAM